MVCAYDSVEGVVTDGLSNIDPMPSYPAAQVLTEGIQGLLDDRWYSRRDGGQIWKGNSQHCISSFSFVHAASLSATYWIGEMAMNK